MSAQPLITCLSVTCRPQWHPWLRHQFEKFTYPNKQLVVLDDALTPSWPGALRAKLKSLGEKRQHLLDNTSGAFCWMDDDDWHPAHRLDVGAKMLSLVDVVGHRDGLFVDSVSHRTRRLATGDPVVFNGAVFSEEARRWKFQPLHRGEDTVWMQLVCANATICSTPQMQHAWLCHDANVTGRRGSMTFEGPKFAEFDGWELEFLKGVTT